MLMICVGVPANWVEIWTFIVLSLTLAAIAWYAYDNSRNVNHELKPVLGFELCTGLPKGQNGSSWDHLVFEIRNYTKTDAIGFINLQLRINGHLVTLDSKHVHPNDPTKTVGGDYTGEKFWYWPALQGNRGHTSIKSYLSSGGITAPCNSRVELKVFLSFTFWESGDKWTKRVKRFYAPPKVYYWRYDNGKVQWVPQLTYDKEVERLEPNWSVVESGRLWSGL